MTRAERREKKKNNQRKMRVTGSSVKQLQRLKINEYERTKTLSEFSVRA